MNRETAQRRFIELCNSGAPQDVSDAWYRAYCMGTTGTGRTQTSSTRNTRNRRTTQNINTRKATSRSKANGTGISISGAAQQIYQAITQNPGKSRRELGFEGAKWNDAIRELRNAKRIRTRGVARATRYFPITESTQTEAVATH